MSPLTSYLYGLGIDISNHHVRIARVSFFGRVRNLIEIKLPEGLVVDEKVMKPEEVKKMIDDRLKKEGMRVGVNRTTLLIPESRVFASSLLLSSQRPREEAGIEAKDRAQLEIPIPFDEALVAVAQGKRTGSEVRTTVYAIERRVADGLRSVCDPKQCQLVAMEANSKALLRLFQRYGKSSLQINDPQTLITLIDVGHAWTTISVYHPDGSNLFSRTLSYEFGSLQKGQASLSQQAVDVIHRTIDEIMLYFKEKKMEIGVFLFAGVEAEDDRFKKNDRFYEVGDVVHISGLKKKDIHIYGAAIGAALRTVHPFHYKHQHNFISTSL